MWRSKKDQEVLEAVSRMYGELLGREPDPDSLKHWMAVAAQDGLEMVRAGILASEEFAARHQATSPEYRGYTERELAIFSEFIDPRARPQPGFVVDFMGGRIRTTSLWENARQLDGKVLPLPIPADFHSEAIEWIGTLKSVRCARDRLVAMEFGAGLGPWIVAAGLGARARGIREVRLYGVEADPVHFKLLQQNLADNGFSPEQVTLLHGAVGARAGKAYWPVIEDAREDWGSRPMEQAAGGASTDYLGRSVGKVREVEVLSAVDLLRREQRWDLLHVDIQGNEAEVCPASMAELNGRVHWIVLGTHSRLIEGHMIELFHRAGWELENEKPARFRYQRAAATLEAMTFVDGAQVWRNPRLDTAERPS